MSDHHDAHHRRARILRAFTALQEEAHRHAIEIDALHSLTEHLTGFFTRSMERLMKTAAELDAKIAELSKAVADDEAQDDANDAALQAVITDLRAQLAAGTPTDFGSQIDALEAIRANLHAPASGTTASGTTPT